jgi:tryptophan synthase beta subunit
MGALAATAIVRVGAASPGAAVGATDTIAASLLGGRGAILEILNGNAATDNVTITDFGVTPAGSPLTGNTYSASLATGTNKVFLIVPSQGDPANGGQVTITHSVTPTVTYKLYTPV